MYKFKKMILGDKSSNNKLSIRTISFFNKFAKRKKKSLKFKWK